VRLTGSRTKLSRQGHQVYEALAISEVYTLADQYPAATIIITADVHPERAKAIKHHYTTLHLRLGATAAEVIWELDQLSPNSSITH
jgi:hypothetical protein